MSSLPVGGRGEEAPGGRNLLLVRTGITFALLASVVSVHFQEPELFLAGGFKYLYAAVVLSYGWLLLRFALWGSMELPGPLPFVQALVDVAFVSIIVFATGLYDSVFAFMYVVIILLGSLELFLKGAMIWAVFSATSYVSLLYLQMKGAIVPPGAEDVHLGWAQFLRPTLTNSIGFLLTGVLSGLLGEDIRKTRQRVEAQEHDLRKLESFHKHVVDNIPSGILTADTQGRVNLINNTACGILGVGMEQVTGKPVEEVLAGLELMDPRGESRMPRPEIVFRRADGAEIFLGFSASPLKDARGRVIGRVVIFQDLTPVKQMEERVRIADRLAGVGELAAGLAHEIRNPLTSIAGSSQMLRESPDLPEDARTLLDIIERESTRLNVLITDFLAYTGPSLRNVGPVDMANLIGEVAEAVRAGEAREKGVEVSMPPLGTLLVEGDPEQLKQVLWNLVRNAVQATPAGGHVRLDLFPQVRHGERYAVTTVSDTGIGIDPKVTGKIFNPFFTTKEGGTGLGLAISQRIIQMHRGFIEVRSMPGHGTIFSVFLPERGGIAHAGGAAS
ncbi:MAG: PAS domain S-box protein [Deltaproteobacteria bacterium]|nr:PAS domain S-box protein [Deltaproteobacteria bacterium]